MTASRIIIAAFLAALTSTLSLASADTKSAGLGSDMPVSTTVPDVQDAPLKSPLPQRADSVEYIDIVVENEPLSVRSRRTELDGVLIEASPIFAQLKGEVSIEGTVLLYRRFQDGAEMSLDQTDGKVKANGIPLGALPDYKERFEATTWLSINAISVLTGTNAKEDGRGGFIFTLDERLRPQFDLDLFVNGQRVDTALLQPRSVGPVLLVPLEIIVDELGHSLERLDENRILVTRIQDAARIELDLTTGLITVNSIPRGISPNLTYFDPVNLLLPFTAVETLTGTHIKLEPGSNRIDVELDDRLGGGVLPGELIDEETAGTPFTPESLEYQLSDRGPAITRFNSRYKSLNTSLRYETAGGLESAAELVPGWVS
ncbi:MAG: hypothetical protein AAFQ84_12590, partial [Pseudomonadota bacterium]